MADYGELFLQKTLPGNETWLSVFKKSLVKQTPENFGVTSGASSVADFEDRGPGETFTATAFSKASLDAASEYAAHLDIKYVSLFVTDKDLASAAGTQKKALSADERLDAALAWLKKTGDQVKAKHLESKPMACGYLNNEGVMQVFPFGSVEEMMKNRKTLKGNFEFINTPSTEIRCDCCDARVKRFSSAKLGELKQIDSIAGMPSDELIASVKQSGIKKAVVSGHSKCGGMNALVNLVFDNQDPGHGLDSLKEWLLQNKSDVEEVKKYLEKKPGYQIKGEDGKIKKEVYTFCEMWVAQKNAEKFAKELGDKNVTALYYDIERPAVYSLDLHASLDDVFVKAQKPSSMFPVSEPDASSDGRYPEFPSKNVRAACGEFKKEMKSLCSRGAAVQAPKNHKDRHP